MATLLRPPLVSQGQRKRPIAPVDYFSRPLTLGINPNASVAQLSDSAPPRNRRIHLDVYPNLLGTTLAAAAPATLDLPLRSGRVFDSAWPKRWQPDSLQSQGLIVYDGPEAAIASLTESAPQRRKALSIEQAPNLLSNTLGQSPAIALPLLAIRLDASAPRRAASLSIDAPSSRAVLGDITMPLMADRADASAPARRLNVLSEHFGRSLTLGINPNATVLQLSDSAPLLERSAYAFDPPNLTVGPLAVVVSLDLPLSSGRLDDSAPRLKYQTRTETLYRPLSLGIDLPQALALPLSAGRVDVSAPAVKYQVRIEALSRPLTLGITGNAAVAQLSDSATPSKKAAYAFDPPNLNSTTLAEQLTLPRLAVRIDWSAPPPKRCAYLDAPLNTLIVAPEPSRLPVPPRGVRIVIVSAQRRRVRIRPN